MIYLINQNWNNTSGNHAGIKYLCESLCRLHPDDFVSITVPDLLGDNVKSKFRVIKKIQSILWQYKLKIYYKKIGYSLKKKLKEGDKVFLLEYMTKGIPQEVLAEYLKKSNPLLNIIAMPHLTPMQLKKMYTSNQLKRMSRYVDNLVTLGSSLSKYLIQIGIPKNKITTSFHYVDNEFYKSKVLDNPHKIVVIVMGNNARNVNLLKEVVCQNPNTNFIICQGTKNYKHIFDKFDNVNLVGYVSEEELRNLMDKSDVSLNVMEDTVGSNVIVTSLAMGLAMIVSDVGSIRDYCTKDNAIFCDNNKPESFSAAIKLLESDCLLLKNMQTNSIKLSEQLSIENFYKQIRQL